MAKSKPRGQRTVRGKIQEKFARVGAIAGGRAPGAKSPMTIPRSATPRVKPRGTVTNGKGRSQIVEKSHERVAKSKARSKAKSRSK